MSKAKTYEFDFLVKEELTRHRIYTITASSEEEAKDLLDGFKQEPKVSIPSKEEETIQDYTVLEIWVPEEVDL